MFQFLGFPFQENKDFDPLKYNSLDAQKTFIKNLQKLQSNWKNRTIALNFLFQCLFVIYLGFGFFFFNGSLESIIKFSIFLLLLICSYFFTKFIINLEYGAEINALENEFKIKELNDLQSKELAKNESKKD